MKKYFLSETKSGKWAIRLGIAFVILTALSLIFAAAIGGDPAVVASSPVLSILANILSIMFTLAGPLSFFVGIFTVIKHKEWPVFKSLAILYALVLLMFMLGEFLFPH